MNNLMLWDTLYIPNGYAWANSEFRFFKQARGGSMWREPHRTVDDAVTSTVQESLPFTGEGIFTVHTITIGLLGSAAPMFALDLVEHAALNVDFLQKVVEYPGTLGGFKYASEGVDLARLTWQCDGHGTQIPANTAANYLLRVGSQAKKYMEDDILNLSLRLMLHGVAQ